MIIRQQSNSATESLFKEMSTGQNFHRRNIRRQSPTIPHSSFMSQIALKEILECRYKFNYSHLDSGIEQVVIR